MFEISAKSWTTLFAGASAISRFVKRRPALLISRVAPIFAEVERKRVRRWTIHCPKEKRVTKEWCVFTEGTEKAERESESEREREREREKERDKNRVRVTILVGELINIRR